MYTAQKQWHYGTCEPPIALGGLSIGPKAGKSVLGYYAKITGIIVMNSTIQKQTSISICFENYLATPAASSHQLWYHWSAEPGMAVPPSPKSHLLQLTAASTPTADT